MKHFYLICFLSTFCLSLNGQSTENLTVDDLKDGVWKVKYPGSSVYRYIGEFEMGKPKGVFRHFYKSGKLRSQMTFQGLTGACFVQNYNEDEKLLSEGSYSSGKLKHGIWKIFNSQGLVISKDTWNSGKLNGSHETFYTNGNLVESGNMKSGQKEGEWIRYFENGKKMSIENYSKGKLNGDWISYSDSGRVKVKGKYIEGLRHGEWLFYNDGKIVKNVFFHRGREVETVIIQSE